MQPLVITYNTSIVIISVLVAVIASFIAIELIGRIKATKQHNKLWLFASSFTWGSGIWVMHFIGILAITTDVHFKYDITFTLISLIIPILVVSIAFYLILYKNMTLPLLIFSSLLMGTGISCMHFIGMHGVNIHLEHNPGTTIASISIAITASFLALLFFSKMEHDRLYIYSIPIAAIMGGAISGMHYTSMPPGRIYSIHRHEHSPLYLAVSSDILLLCLMLIAVLIFTITYTIFRRENDSLLKSKLKEMSLAKTVQENSLSLPIENETIHFTAFYKASEELSGDLYYWYKINEKQYGVFIMDVMGHGISASLISMSIKSYLVSLIDQFSTPTQIMKQLSSYMNNMFDGMGNPFYFTAIHAHINTEEKCITYVNAGHPAALWKETGGKVLRLESTCPPIGISEDLPIFSRELYYHKSGRLVLFTDGLLECMNEDQLKQMSIMEELTTLYEEKVLEEFKHQIILNALKKSKFEDDKCLVVVDIK